MPQQVRPALSATNEGGSRAEEGIENDIATMRQIEDCVLEHQGGVGTSGREMLEEGPGQKARPPSPAS